MPGPSFSPIQTPKGWMVSVSPALTSSGKRERRYFQQHKDAVKFGQTLRAEWNRGQRGGILDAATAREAAMAVQVLQPLGISLLEAARMVAKQTEEAQGSPETLQERWLRFSRDQEPHWRPCYAADMAKIPRWVGKELMNTRVCLITPERLRKALKSHGSIQESTIKMRESRVRSVMSGRGSKKRGVKIQLMNLTECARMLRACESPQERWVVALLLWAGIRPSAEDGEISRLDWSAVGEKEIYIEHEVSKTGRDRHIPITPRLRRLLRGCPKDGPVLPSNWKKIYQRLRKAIGIGNYRDITRHTFASMFLAAYGEKATKSAMGHTANSDTLFRHYRRAVTEEAGVRFFR